MMVAGAENAGGDEDLPPHPPTIPSNLKPGLVAPPKYSIMTRPCRTGTTGRRITLLANHFKVSVNNPDAVFYQYSVHMTYEDNRPVLPGIGIGRKLMDKLYQTYSMEFDGKKFAYDGEKALYTVGPLPLHKLSYTVVLEESVSRPHETGSSSVTEKRMKQSIQSKTFNVEISYATKITLKPIALALKGADADDGQDALRVLDIVLRQQAANRGCLLVRQSFFHDDSRCITDVRGTGLSTVRGFHSSFRPSQGGLTLNMDVSTTLILKPGPVIDFLKDNQEGVQNPLNIDWERAKRMLKNMRIKTRHRNMEFKITGLSQKSCLEQYFPMKLKSGDGTTEDQTVDITVYEYFTKHRGIKLTYSANLPCLDVGKPKRPNYVPLELCSLVSLQRYKKALSSKQRASIVGSSTQRPQERINSVTNAVRNYGYNDDPVLAACGISIDKQLTQIEGHVLEAPKLKVGNNEDMMPFKGRWNFKGKSFLDPSRINSWLVVNFSGSRSCDISQISRELINVGKKTGIKIERPKTLIEEDPQAEKLGPVARVDKMFEQIQAKLKEPPEFILCVIPKKGSDIYGPWKKKTLVDYGIPTQCISPPKLISDLYLTNVLMKINTKLGGINSLLALEYSSRVPLIYDTPTMILGMDVSHGSPGRSDDPSVAAVVGSRNWPLMSRYRAAVRTQSSKVEMIDGLYKPLPNGNDDGIIRELLLDFYRTSKGRKPTQIIVFRDGVSESQFNQVLNIELDQIVKAYRRLGGEDAPKFTLIIAQKNHHTRLFQAKSPDNVPPGTVVDTKIVHPRIFDFYMCAQAGMIGTSRPAHYHVLLDEIGFSPDDLQNLIHSLSYVYQRSCTAISIVAPIRYAHLAAAQVGQFMKFEDLSETLSAKGSVTTSESIPVPELPRLHKNVQSSMFFC